MDIHLLSNWIILLKIFEFIYLRCLYTINYLMFPFFALSFMKHFCIPEFLHWAQARGLCWFCCYPISKVHFWTHSRTEPGAMFVFCSGLHQGCSAHWLCQAASATWHLCKLSDVDVAEQVDNQKKKTTTNLFKHIFYVKVNRGWKMLANSMSWRKFYIKICKLIHNGSISSCSMYNFSKKDKHFFFVPAILEAINWMPVAYNFLCSLHELKFIIW